jgi:hypothetical protein
MSWNLFRSWWRHRLFIKMLSFFITLSATLLATGAKNRSRDLFMMWHAEHTQIVCRNSLKTAFNKHSAQWHRQNEAWKVRSLLTTNRNHRMDDNGKPHGWNGAPSFSLSSIRSPNQGPTIGNEASRLLKITWQIQEWQACKPVKHRHYFKKWLKNETQSNTKVGAIAQRLCLCGRGFKRSYAMVGSSSL